MTPEEQTARLEELEELFAAQRKALVALLAVVDEQSLDEIKHAIHELLHYPGHPRHSDSAG
jgi:hypothetical protein